MFFIFYLVLGFSVASAASSTTSPSPTPPLGVWESFGRGWGDFGATLVDRIKAGLRESIGAYGPTRAPKLDWGGSRFSFWASGVGSWFGNAGQETHLFFNRTVPAALRKAVGGVGWQLLKVSGVDPAGIVAQQAAASMAQRSAPAVPTHAPKQDWRIAFAPFLLVFAFLAGVAGGMLGLPRLKHWCACLWLLRRSRRGVAAELQTVSVTVPQARAGALALGVLAAQVGCAPVQAFDAARYSAAPVAQRPCWFANFSALTFSNCCNASDVLWCTPWLCWTLPGCAICTEREGCWTILGGGVSVYPRAQDAQVRRTAMDAFGFIGWVGVVAEGLRLGEVYAIGLAAGVFLVSSGLPSDLVCNVTCSQASTTWWYETAPTLTTVVSFLQTVPTAVWSLIEAMPLLFGSLLLFYLAAGRWVQVLMLVLSVPGVLTDYPTEAPCPSYEGAEGTLEQYPFRKCTASSFRGNGSECVCPFGVVIRHFDAERDPLLNFGAICPEHFNGSSYYWLCGWGSWWWLVQNVERPYSHPYMPPSPFSAICYVLTNRSLLYKDIFVQMHTGGKGRYPNYTEGLLGPAPVSTCMLDRRPSFCGDCFGGCFYQDGRHDRPFGVCGGGVRDGPWFFLPLATVSFPNQAQRERRAWYKPDRYTADLLATKYGPGVGCGTVHGILHCWSCNLTVQLPDFNGLPPGMWLPLPGQPTEVCINPQYARARMPPPNNWLAGIQHVFDTITGNSPCKNKPGWYPVCANSAFFPPDGGFVVMAGDSQSVTATPSLLRHMLGLYVALVVFAVSAGARVIPALSVLFFFFWSVSAQCYPACEGAWCNAWWCLAWNCHAYNPSLCLPSGRVLGCGSGSSLPPDYAHTATAAAVGYAVGAITGLPHAAWVYALSPLVRRVPVARPVDFVCGPVVSETSLVWWDPDVLAFAILGFIFLAPTLLLAWPVLALASVGIRTHFPYRLFAAAIQVAATSWRELFLVLSLAWVAADLTIPGAEAALNQMVVAAPLAGWACRLPTWPEVVLGLLSLILYAGTVGRPRLAALAAYKLSRGLGGVVLFGLLVLRGSDRGVLGYCLLDVDPYSSAWWPTLDGAWWFVSAMLSLYLFLFSLMSQRGAAVKLRVYARWCRLYTWLEVCMEVGVLGTSSRWRGHVSAVCLFFSFLFPGEMALVSLFIVSVCAFVDMLDVTLEYFLTCTINVNYLLASVNYFHSYFSDEELRAFLRRRWARGEVLYNHCGQVSASLRRRVLDLHGTLEPVTLEPSRLREVHDDSLLLTCGRWVGRDPVVARCGSSVLVGTARDVCDLPPGYRLTAPLLVLREPMGFWQTLKVSLLGRGDAPPKGQIVLLGTSFSMAMGFGLGGVLYTTFHSSKNRSLATPNGPRNSYWYSASDDVVCYPLPSSLSSLEPCRCSSHSRWVITRTGTLIHALNTEEGKVRLDCATRIRDLKGASGSPVLCDQGHAVGMMVGAIVQDGMAQQVRYVKPWDATPAVGAQVETAKFPTVPADGYKEEPYFAPTGSGKSTKLPAQLAQEGHKVLVLNPSVVTTKAMGPYMKKLTGKSPNIFAGTGAGALAIKTGSRITYCTYGRFLVSPQAFLQDKTVVICDECHAVDGTSVLGIGTVRCLAQEAGVRLVVFATATPPGTTLTPHANITEVVLDSGGDIPFYGTTLKSELYKVGRHVIFCHSKAECKRVAEELAARGVKAVSYWRGKDPSVLTDAPDLTVVATDAISTGYTGNFATCTDCCSAVEEDVEVDLNPTFTIALVTRAANAALRIQRRGRCGRGAPGTYYAVQEGAPPSGVCPSSTSWSAAEAAFMWYGMTAPDVTKFLESFQDCPYTSRLTGSPGDAVRVLATLLPLAHCLEVTQEAVRETSWPMLVGIQKRVCAEADAAPPSDDVRWCGVNGTNATPLLYRIGAVTSQCVSHPLALKMAAVLGDTSYHDTTLGPVLLVGAAVAAAFAIADATGSLVMLCGWSVMDGGAPLWPDATTVDMRGSTQGKGPMPANALPPTKDQGKTAAIAPSEQSVRQRPAAKDPTVTPSDLARSAESAEAVSEVATSLDYPFLQTLALSAQEGATRLKSACAGAAKGAEAWWNGAGFLTTPCPATESAFARGMCFLEQYATSLFAGGAALAAAKSSPAFTVLASFVAGAGLVVPSRVAWLLTIAGGSAVAALGGPQVGVAAAGALWAGTWFGGLSWVDSLLAGAAGYEACISTCALTLDLLDGKAKWQDALPCLAGFLAPGAAIAGVAIALVLRGSQAGDMTPWLNRLLSMLPRSQVLPDGFFAEKKDKILGDVVRRLSLVTLVKNLCDRVDKEEYIYTSSTWVGRLCEFCLTVFRYLHDSVTARLPSLRPSVPLISCQPGYVGAWTGEGTGVTECTCGNQVTITSAPGGDPVINAAPLCRAYWRGGSFPINTTTSFTGSLQPDLQYCRDVTLLVGYGHAVRLQKRGDEWYITKTSMHALTRVLVSRAAARGPVEADGRPVSAFAVLNAARFGEGQYVQYEGAVTKLPIRYGRLTFPNIPYLPAVLPESCEDAVECMLGPAEAATQAAMETAKEAMNLAEEVSTQASGLLESAYESRRRAEYEAWLVRERALGRVEELDPVRPGSPPVSECDSEDLADICARIDAAVDAANGDEESSGPAGEGPRLRFKSTDECLKEGSASDDPLLDRGATHLMMEEVELGAPQALSSEPILKDVEPPELPEAVSDTVEAVVGAVQAVASTAKAVAGMASQGYVKARAAAEDSVTGLLHAARKLANTKAQALRKEGESVQLYDLTPPQDVLVRMTCFGQRRNVRLKAEGKMTLFELETKLKMCSSPNHSWAQGRLGLTGATRLDQLGAGEVISLDLSCPASKGFVLRRFVHKCCGEDRSVTRSVHPQMLLGCLSLGWPDGTWIAEGKEVSPHTCLGDLPTVIELIHEEKCGLSYIWSGRAIKVDAPKEAPVTRPLTASLRARADRVYVTDPINIDKRIAKVTIDQVEAIMDTYFKDAYNLAIAKAKQVTSRGYSFEEAVSKLKPNSAKAHNCDLTVKDLKEGRGRKLVETCLDEIRTGTLNSPFMLRPKCEVFPQTKETHKPPRLIVYPSLEMRVAEKMLLGDPAVVAKAVLGRAYGFQYPPHERAAVLVSMWKSKRTPVAYTVDGACFDSTVTPADIKREGEIFAAASLEPDAIRQLHAIYAEHPMKDPSGNIVGYRRCRASGTLTTSAGNSITCYLKVSAACRKAGLRDPSFLIHGDDVVIVCERDEEDKSQALGAALASYGYDCVPTRHADLTTAESCSASLDTVRTVRGTKHVLRCDMRRGLGRTMAEYGDPVGTAWGYALNYPCHPVCMYILLPLLLQTALNGGGGPDQRVTIDIRGNSLQLPLQHFGRAVRGLHGRDSLAVTGHSATALQETFDCLQFFGMRGLGHWRRYRRKVKLRLLRAGGQWAALARELLWDPGDVVPPVLSPGDVVIPPDLWEHSWEGLSVSVESVRVQVPWWAFLSVAALALLLI